MFLVKDLLFVKYAPLFIGGMLIYRIHRYGRPPAADAILLAPAGSVSALLLASFCFSPA